VLTSDLNIKYGKRLEKFETTTDGQVIATFKDGTVAKGGLLVGADGNNSVVREGLMDNSKLTPLPINLIGVARHFTPEQAVLARALNPLLFFAMHPHTNIFYFYSIQVFVGQSFTIRVF
jgi:2-polyprenyl-6-methoxyphenol hydroxylase-like FAD-dependent oxidoreductase